MKLRHKFTIKELTAIKDKYKALLEQDYGKL